MRGRWVITGRGGEQEACGRAGGRQEAVGSTAEDLGCRAIRRPLSRGSHLFLFASAEFVDYTLVSAFPYLA